MTYLRLSINCHLLLIQALAWLALGQISHAQGQTLPGEVSKAPPVKEWPGHLYSDERFFKAEQMVLHATELELAALRDDDPLLADVYLSLPSINKMVGAVEADMRRRPAIAVAILMEAFRHPPYPGTRNAITLWLRDNAWMNPAQFLPLIRDWYKELKIDDPGFNKGNIMSFLEVWGYPEDEAILRDYEADSFTMRLFRERLQRLKTGDSMSNPNIPPEYQHLDYVVKPIGMSQAASTSPPQKAEMPKLADHQVKSTQVLAQQTLPNLRLVWAIVILAAIGLVWLALRKRKRH